MTYNMITLRTVVLYTKLTFPRWLDGKAFDMSLRGMADQDEGPFVLSFGSGMSSECFNYLYRLRWWERGIIYSRLSVQL